MLGSCEYLLQQPSILGKQEKDGHYPGGILDVGSMDEMLHNTIKYAKKSKCMGLPLVFFNTTTWQVKCQMYCFYYREDGLETRLLH